MYRKNTDNLDSLHRECSQLADMAVDHSRSANLIGGQKGQTQTGALKSLRLETEEHVLIGSGLTHPRRAHL